LASTASTSSLPGSPSLAVLTVSALLQVRTPVWIMYKKGFMFYNKFNLMWDLMFLCNMRFLYLI
jgi:hypothetical protein